MAKWLPMLTGALKEGAQKLLSVFTKSKESTDSLGLPKDVAKSIDEQPDLSAPLPKEYPYSNHKSEETRSSPRATPPERPSASQSETADQGPTEDTVTSPSPQEVPTELPKGEGRPEAESIQQAAQSAELPELPEWPKTVMEASGISSGSQFTSSGAITTPSQQEVQQPRAPEPQSAPQTTTQEAPEQQVVSGYSRTERLLEMILFRGIPVHKPPRGP